jgi:hypothetical protein
MAPDGNHPPVVRSAVINPNPIVLSAPVSVTVDAQDVDRDRVRLRYRWYANGQPVTERDSNVIESRLFKRGDQIVVEVMPSDGKTEGRGFRSGAVTVGNTAPVVSAVSVELDQAASSRKAHARSEVTDPDGDNVGVRYRWYKGETVVNDGEDSSLDVSTFMARETLQVEVIASDGAAAPTVARSKVYEFSNTPPRIMSTPGTVPQNGQYAYQVQAEDPDGDAIVFSLEDGPPGMTIDARSGLISWTPAADAAGVKHVRIMAKDARGGFATQEFDLTLTAQAKSS